MSKKKKPINLTCVYQEVVLNYVPTSLCTLIINGKLFETLFEKEFARFPGKRKDTATCYRSPAKNNRFAYGIPTTANILSR